MAVMGDITKGIQKMDLKAAGTSLDIDGHLRLLQQIHNRFKSLSCREPTCQARLSIGGATEHLKAWFPYAKGSQAMPVSAVLCNKCKKYTCVGCRQKPALGSKAITIRKSPEVTISNCCENGKIFGIWVLLSAFDESELLFQKQTIESTPSSYHRQPAFKGTGTGYASGRASTNRYQMWNPYAASGLSFPQHIGNNEMQDKVKTDVLRMLLPFLPSLNSKPVPELVALFRLSRLCCGVAEE